MRRWPWPKLSLFLLASLLLVSCETKEYAVTSVNPVYGSLNEGSFYSKETFSGISSLSDITDTTVTVNWKTHTAAKEFEVYIGTGDAKNLYQRVDASRTFLIIDKLSTNTTYTFNVRMRDQADRVDANEVELIATTLTSPAPPYYLYRSNPIKEVDAVAQPSIMIFGVNPGDLVTLYTDSSCSTLVGTGTATSSFIEIKTDELSLDVNHTFYAKRKNHETLESSCSTATATYNLKTCPDGYVLIPKNPNLSLPAFCVMEYEARAWSDSDSDNVVDTIEVDSDGCNESACTTENWGVNSFVPGSTASGLPWRMLTAESAKARCQALGSGYDLISNTEWIAVAANLENVSSNWSGGSVGSGCLFRGNAGVADACGYAKNAIDGGTVRDGKARLNLSNGNTIWDIAGNVNEWVDFGTANHFSLGPNYCTDGWSEISTDFCTEQLSSLYFYPRNPANISPASSYNSDYGLGKMEGGTGGVMLRGGAYQYGAAAGIYAVTFSSSLTTARQEIGFRCVYRKQ